MASRFSVSPDQITSQGAIPRKGFLPAGQELTIPKTLRYVTPAQVLLPDSELIYSPSAIGFDVAAFVQEAGGSLSTYYESVQEERFSGAAIIQRVAEAYSVNPRLLLAFLEYRSHWVYGQPADPRDVSYPIGFEISGAAVCTRRSP